MRIKTSIFILLSLVALGTMSCTKDPSIDDYYDFIAELSSPSSGDDKKIDVKGSLMNGDMKHPNIEAWLSEKTLYVKFNEKMENCMILVFTSGGRMVYSRQVEKQYPGIVRIYMGDKSTDTYRLYITDGRKEAEGKFFLRSQKTEARSKNKTNNKL